MKTLQVIGWSISLFMILYGLLLNRDSLLYCGLVSIGAMGLTTLWQMATNE